MKNILLPILLIQVVVSSGFASVLDGRPVALDDFERMVSFTASAIPINTTLHDSLDPGEGYVSSPTSSGVLGVSAYDVNLPGGLGAMELSEFSFAGGVTEPDGGLVVRFLDAEGAEANSFSLTLPVAGPARWTIPLAGGLIVPAEGQVEIVTAGDTLGQWLMSTSNEASAGVGALLLAGDPNPSPTFQHAFAFSGIGVLEITPVPEPSAIVFSLFAALFFVRRRR